MAIQIKHAFTSLKGDGTDATLVQPSQWNALHSTSMATGNLIGRLSAGAGAFEEIAISAAIAAALNSADGQTFLASLGLGGFTTGDGKITLKSVADNGWLLMDDGTFGDALSGSSNRNNADTLNLFTLLYSLSDAVCPIFTSGGAATTRAAQGLAATAFGAHVRMSLPKQLGRAIVCAGTGAGLTFRALASIFGEESHLLTQAEMPAHYHTAGIYDPGHGHGTNANSGSTTTGGGGFSCGYIGTATINANGTGVRLNSSNGLDTTNTTGGNGYHNITQASTAWNVMVKL